MTQSSLKHSGSNPPPRQLPLPAMAAIAFWMLALSVIGVVGVLTHRYPGEATRIAALVLSSLFALAGLGLLRLRRWGWALTLAAAFVSMGFSFYGVFRLHQTEWLVMAIINLVFFLYLVRPEVLDRLR